MGGVERRSGVTECEEGPEVEESGISNTIVQELAGAIAAGTAPQFHVVTFKADNHWVDETSSWLRVHLVLLLDGQLVEIVDERVVKEREKNGRAYDGELGSVDVMRCALRGALQRRWPEIAQYLEEVRVEGYCAFESELDRSHHIQISFKVACSQDEPLRPVTNEGVDTIGKTRLALIKTYHWIAWRLLRRLRGEERKNGGQ